MLTDGITEVASERDEEFGLARVEQLLSQEATQPLSQEVLNSHVECEARSAVVPGPSRLLFPTPSPGSCGAPQPSVRTRCSRLAKLATFRRKSEAMRADGC
jgi:hypothetical protein